jgi:hypothetical protein
MYEQEFFRLTHELGNANQDQLGATARQGGWRKRLIDAARQSDDREFPFCTSLFAAFIKLLPPIGRAFRRALVAQAILDSKAVVWK